MNSEPNFLLDVLFVTQVWRIAFRQKLRRADILRIYYGTHQRPHMRVD